jgi:intracellular septation protein A
MIFQPKVSNFIESVPLIVFLLFYKFTDPVLPHDWAAPYLAGAVAGVLIMIFLRVTGSSLNPIFIGINIYFVSGFLGLMFEQTWLIQLYRTLRASGMLAWIVISGVVSICLSPTGFIGIASKHKHLVNAYSVYLLVVAIGACLLAYWFRTNHLFSETVPFALLFLGYGILKMRIAAKIDLEEN